MISGPGLRTTDQRAVAPEAGDQKTGDQGAWEAGDQGALEELAWRAARQLKDATAEEILHWAVQTFGPRFVVASSMQDAVLVHLAARVAPGIDVLFLDTGYHFAETIGTRDAVAVTYDVNLITVTPRQTVAEQDAEHGHRLHDRNPDLCCALRKVMPLDRALAGYHAWATGVRQAESPTRMNTPVVSYEPRRDKVKVAPMATWSDADVGNYVAEHGILVNPLLSVGYPSIGCAPCTRVVTVGEDPRAGRWTGFTKTECGIHR